MTSQPPATVSGPMAGEAWLILKVALPRLARRLHRVNAWLDRYTPERFSEAADELRTLSGAEGLALLAAISPDRRATALEQVELDDEDRRRLHQLAGRLGDPADERSLAAGLVRMVPVVEAASLEIPRDEPRNAAGLIAQGWEASNRGNARLAQQLAHKALSLLRARDGSADRALEHDALNLQGVANNTLGETAAAIGSYEKALAIAREIGDRRGEGNALGNLGLVYADLAQIDKAIGCYEQALVIAREIGDRQGEGAELSHLGVVYADLHQLDKAISSHEQALIIFREIGDRRSEGAALGNLGLAYAKLGQADKAMSYYEQALAIAREIGDRRGEGDALGNLGLVYADLAQIDKAIGCYEQALVIAREIGHRHGEGSAVGNLASAYAKLGQADKAMSYHEQTLAIAREIGDRRGEGRALFNLGLAYANLGQVNKAISSYERASVIFREIVDREGEGFALGNLGLAYGQLGQLTKSINFFEQVSVIFREIGNRAGQAETLVNLGVAHYKLGEVNKAISYYEHSLVIVREIGDRRGEGSTLVKLGLAYANLGQVDKATSMLAQALLIGTEINEPRIVQNASANLQRLTAETPRTLQAHVQNLRSKPMTCEKDPITVAFLDGHRLKETARKSVADLELYRQAADRFQQAGALAEQSLTDPASDDEMRRAGKLFAPYYHYEAQRCLAAYFYEKRDTPKAKEHLDAGAVLLKDHIATLEHEIKAAPTGETAGLTSILETARFYQRNDAVWSEAIPARAAWDSGQFIDALDRYRRMAARNEELLIGAKRLSDPTYERITFGNLIGALGNCSAAMVQHHLTIAGVPEGESGKTVPYDLACDILRHLLKAYLYGMAAFEANPEWSQYRDGAMLCRRYIEESLRTNKASWRIVYPRFLDEPEFLKMMAAVDLDLFRALTQSGVTTQMPASNPLRILFVAANPKDTDPLRLDEEIRTIEERLRLSKHASRFEIKQAWAVRVKDLQDSLLRHDPHIVHFSGHGSDYGEIVLENVQGESQPVPPKALSGLFKVLKGGGMRGVVLNLCGSLSQARAIVKQVEFVIGMSDEVGDETAIAFAASFYQGLGYGKSVRTAFELGRNQVHLEGLAEEDLPKLLVRKGVDPDRIVLVETSSEPTASEEISPKGSKPSRPVPPPSMTPEEEHSIRFSVDEWKVWRERGNLSGDKVVFIDGWRRGDVRYSCTIRLRNNLESEDQLHRFRADFRKGDQSLFTDTYVLDDKPVVLPSKKWVSLDVCHGVRDHSIAETADSIWLVAETVGDNVRFEWLLAKLAVKVEELEEA